LFPNSNNLPRIAYVLQDFAIGGIETALYNVATALCGAFEFHFVATHVDYISPKFRSTGRVAYIPRPRDLVRYLREYDVDIVQTHNLRLYVDCAVAAGVPVIVERVAGNRAASNPKRGVDWVIASNHGTLPLIHKTIDPSRVTVIYNGLDIDTISSAPAERLGFGPEDVIVGRVSRLGRGQNIPMLIDAMIQVNRGYPHAKLVIVGGPSRMPGAEDVTGELVEQAKPLGENAVFTGEVDAPYGLIQGFDIATCVSNHEGIPNSLIEPMACGKPVVSTAVGQVQELVEDGQSGFLVPCGDTQALARRLGELVADAPLRAQMGRWGRKTVTEKFNRQTQARKYADLYHALLDANHGKMTEGLRRAGGLGRWMKPARILERQVCELRIRRAGLFQ